MMTGDKEGSAASSNDKSSLLKPLHHHFAPSYHPIQIVLDHETKVSNNQANILRFRQMTSVIVIRQQEMRHIRRAEPREPRGETSK
jgi:riboflavin biosynthesis pyrimidine reductase